MLDVYVESASLVRGFDGLGQASVMVNVVTIDN